MTQTRMRPLPYSLLSGALGARLVPSLLLVAVLALAPEPLAAQEAGAVMEVRPAATFLRASPDLRGTVVLRLVQGDRVEVLDRSGGDWWRVRAGDPPREGYVHRLVLATPRGPARPGPSRLPPPPGPERVGAGEGTQAPAAPGDDAPVTPARRGPGMALYGGAGVFLPTARDTFDAVDITGNPLVVLGGVEVTRVYRGLFVGAHVERVSETGERAFLTDDGQRFGLGIPLDVEMLPIEATVGWRFEPAGPRPSRIVPFAGGGAGILRYRESDPFATPDEEVDEQFASYHVVAGADVALARWIGVRVAYRYRFVPDAIGEAGVSAVTGDTSLGGSTVAVAVVLGR